MILVKLQENYLQKKTNEADWIFGLSVFGEIIQYGEESASKYIGEILNKCSEFLSNKKAMNELPDSKGLKQSIAFTVGIIASQRKYHKSLNPKWWTNAIKSVIIDNSNSINCNALARENAVSAIGKIMDNYWNDLVVLNGNNNNNNDVNLEMIGAWIEMLPIREDVEERLFCNEFLLKILQMRIQNVMLLNVLLNKFGNKMVAKLVEIIAVALVSGDKQNPQFKAMFEHIKGSCNDQNVMKQIIQQLTPELKQAFN